VADDALPRGEEAEDGEDQEAEAGSSDEGQVGRVSSEHREDARFASPIERMQSLSSSIHA
jgi:hypothetical protein